MSRVNLLYIYAGYMHACMDVCTYRFAAPALCTARSYPAAFAAKLASLFPRMHEHIMGHKNPQVSRVWFANTDFFAVIVFVVYIYIDIIMYASKGSAQHPTPGKAIGDSSTLTLLTALENSNLWSDARMEDVQVYLQTSKYAYVDPELRAILLRTDSASESLP